MKVRVTLMTENNKHIEGKTKEEIERNAVKAWTYMFGLMCLDSENNDTVQVESCELIEN